MEGLREQWVHESPEHEKLWSDTLAAIEAFKKNSSYKYGLPTRRPVNVQARQHASPTTTRTAYTPATSLGTETKTAGEEKTTETVFQEFTQEPVNHANESSPSKCRQTSNESTKTQAPTKPEEAYISTDGAIPPCEQSVESPAKLANNEEVSVSDSTSESSDEVVYRQDEMGRRRGGNPKKKQEGIAIESGVKDQAPSTGPKLGDGLVSPNTPTNKTTAQPQTRTIQTPFHNGQHAIQTGPRAHTNGQHAATQRLEKETPKPSSGITHSHPKKNMAQQSDGPGSNPRDIKEELKRLQEEALAELGKKVLGINEDEEKVTSLDLARQGPGVDPNSEITRQLRRMITYSMKLPAIAQNPQNTANIVSEEGSREETGEEKDDTSNRPNSAGGQSEKADDLSPMTGHWKQQGEDAAAEHALPPKIGNNNEPSATALMKSSLEAMQIDEQQFCGLVVDWQYRSWHTCNDPHFVPQFRRWLENTLLLGKIVDIKDENFRNGRDHPNGVDGFEAPEFEEPITLLDQSDPHTAAHYHETSLGYMYNWNARIEEEKAKEMEKQEREKAQKQRATTQASKPKVEKPVVNENAPKANIYLRPVELKDVDSLVNLYNFYIKNTVRCIDLHQVTHQDMVDRIDECERERFPFIIAAERKTRFGHALNGQRESVWGFASVCDFTGPQTANRYTAELEIFVHPDKKHLGIGRCLMDKVLEICDSGYVPKRGYFFDCATNQRAVYCVGGSRTLIRLIAIVHYAADDAAEYNWIRKWLESEYKFEEQALLKGTGVNKNKLLNSSYLVRNSLHVPDSVIRPWK